MKHALLLLAALAAFAGFGYTPVAYTNSFTRDGVTYVQRGALGTSDYVATNIDSSAVGKVQSVNSKTGDVVLAAKDVGAVPTNITEDVFVSLSELLNLFPNGTTNGVRISVNGLELDILIDTNANMIVFGDRKLSDYGITDALKDDISSLTNSVAFTNAVAKVSPPIVLPDKWALANVTNETGGAVEAADIGAWSLDNNNTVKNQYQYLYFDDGNSTTGYFNFGINGRGPHIDLYDLDGDYKIALDNTKVSIKDNQGAKNVAWRNILSSADISQSVQPYSPLNAQAISSQALLTYFTNEFKPWLWGEFDTKTNTTEKYRTIATSYNRDEVDAKISNQVLTKIYADGTNIYQTADGKYYKLVGGANWDCEDDYYHDHFTFYPIGEYEWKCDAWGIMTDEPSVVLYFNDAETQWVVRDFNNPSIIYDYTNGGQSKDADTISFNFMTFTKVSGALSYKQTKSVAYNETLSKLWNDSQTKYIDGDGTVYQKLDEYFSGTGYAWSGSLTNNGSGGYYCASVPETASSLLPCTLSFIGSGWQLKYSDNTIRTTTGSLLDDKIRFEQTGYYTVTFTRVKPYAQIDKVAYTNELSEYVQTTRKINGHPLTNDLEIAGMDYEAMTNTVNEVKAKFYDQPLQVEWTVRMVNGDMKLYATTNVNTSVLNN